MSNATPTAKQEVERTCRTCGHRSGAGAFAKCALSGFYIETERKYPVRCGHDFAGWTHRSGLLDRIRHFFKGTSR